MVLPGQIVSDEDRLPHDRAVWRDYAAVPTPYEGAPAPGTSGRQVSLEYGSGPIVQSWGHLADWRGVKRWRFGWAPRTGSGSRS